MRLPPKLTSNIVVAACLVLTLTGCPFKKKDGKSGETTLEGATSDASGSVHSVDQPSASNSGGVPMDIPRVVPVAPASDVVVTSDSVTLKSDDPGAKLKISTPATTSTTSSSASSSTTDSTAATPAASAANDEVFELAPNQTVVVEVESSSGEVIGSATVTTNAAPVDVVDVAVKDDKLVVETSSKNSSATELLIVVKTDDKIVVIDAATDQPETNPALVQAAIQATETAIAESLSTSESANVAAETSKSGTDSAAPTTASASNVESSSSTSSSASGATSQTIDVPVEVIEELLDAAVEDAELTVVAVNDAGVVTAAEALTPVADVPAPLPVAGPSVSTPSAVTPPASSPVDALKVTIKGEVTTLTVLKTKLLNINKARKALKRELHDRSVSEGRAKAIPAELKALDDQADALKAEVKALAERLRKLKRELRTAVKATKSADKK